MPSVMVLGGGAFGRCLDHEGGLLMNGISALVGKDTRDLPCPYCHVRSQQKDSHLGSRPSPDTKSA